MLKVKKIKIKKKNMIVIIMILYQELEKILFH